MEIKMKYSNDELLKMFKKASKTDGNIYGDFEYVEELNVVKSTLLSSKNGIEKYKMAISSDENPEVLEFNVEIDTLNLEARIYE